MTTTSDLSVLSPSPDGMTQIHELFSAPVCFGRSGAAKQLQVDRRVSVRCIICDASKRHDVSFSLSFCSPGTRGQGGLQHQEEIVLRGFLACKALTNSLSWTSRRGGVISTCGSRGFSRLCKGGVLGLGLLLAYGQGGLVVYSVQPFDPWVVARKPDLSRMGARVLPNQAGTTS